MSLWSSSFQPLRALVPPTAPGSHEDGRPPRLFRSAVNPGAQDDAARRRLPLYQRAGCVALLDDDPDFVETLSMTLPPSWGVRGFLRPDTCRDHLQQETPLWEADLWAQQDIVARWNAGTPLIPLILQYWAGAQNRHKLTRVLVIDYHMAGTNGVEVLRDLVEWPGYRVLLTGVADQSIAISAFNSGLIHQFLMKQQRDLLGFITASVQSLLLRPMERYHQIWSATLRPDQVEILQRPTVAAELEAFLGLTFKEWMLLGEPFGALALDWAGRAHWVQLELESELDALAEVAAAAGAHVHDVHQVREGRRLANVELRQLLGLPGADFPLARRVGEETGVLAGITHVDLQGAYPSLAFPQAYALTPDDYT